MQPSQLPLSENTSINKNRRNLTTQQHPVPFKSYDNSLESKIRWVEPQHKHVSAINSSSVKYDIISNCKSEQLPQLEISRFPKFANKKESHSKFVDFQSSNADKICLAHNVALLATL